MSPDFPVRASAAPVLRWQGLGKHRTFAGKVSIDLPELKPGDYQMLLTVTDAASQRSASVTLPFSIVG